MQGSSTEKACDATNKKYQTGVEGAVTTARSEERSGDKIAHPEGKEAVAVLPEIMSENAKDVGERNCLRIGEFFKMQLCL